jgi:hypothetical protein
MINTCHGGKQMKYRMIPGCGKDREDHYVTGSRINFLEKNKEISEEWCEMMPFTR